MRRDPLHTALFAAAIFLGVLPLWAGTRLPLVDLPQHLHLISVLHRLHDPTTLYPEWFAARGQLTPYLGYYLSVSLLNWLMPLELANRLFLSAYVAAMPLSLAFLLRSFRRPTWPALLCLPFAYGDSFGWGFINYIAALPLAFLCLGLFVRAIDDAPRRLRWAAWLSVTLAAVLLMHVQAFAFLAFALPALLFTTRAPEDGLAKSLKDRVWPRRFALAAVLPGVLLFLVWVGLRAGEPTEVESGAPWKAWGPMLSAQNLSYKSFDQNLHELIPTLANLLRDESDHTAVWAAFGIALAAIAFGLFSRKVEQDDAVGLFRLVLLTAIAAALYFTLPFDIRGYMYYLNTRYAHLIAALAVTCVPVIEGRAARGFLVAATVSALVLCVPLFSGFARFDREASELDGVIPAAAPKAKVMGFIFNTGSAVVTHPVYLHMGAEVARKTGGIANFSFALTPHSPVKYSRTPPPAPPSEWRPDQFDFATMGPAYDHFLIRGAEPERVLGRLLGTELEVAARSGSFSLVRRR